MRSVAGGLSRLVLASTVAACFSAGAVARAADIHSEALAVPHPGGLPIMGTIPRPGHPDYYVHESSGTLTVEPVHAPPGCMLAEPLRVSLFNPEGHWIQRILPVTGSHRYRDTHPFPGRYLVQVAIVDPSCGGITYRIGAEAPIVVGGSGSHNGGGNSCSAASANVIGPMSEQQKLAAAVHQPHLSKTALSRLQKQLGAANRRLAQAKAKVPKGCPTL